MNKTTVLGAGAKPAQKIIFISEAHEKFYYEKLNIVRNDDVYHTALVYCLGIVKVVRLAFNLYCNGTPRGDDRRMS